MSFEPDNDAFEDADLQDAPSTLTMERPAWMRSASSESSDETTGTESDDAEPDFETEADFEIEEIIQLELADEEDPADSGRGSIAGTIASVIIHVWLLMNLAQMTVEEDISIYEPPLETRITPEEPEPEEVEVVEYELANPDDRELEVREVVNAASVGLSQTMTPKVETEPRPIDELLPTVRKANMYDIPEGVEVDESIVVKGTNGEALVQLESALDRVTWEVAKNLQEKRVLLVWLLDSSGSLTKQRQIIAKRLRRVYGELDALKKTDQIPRHEMPLLSGVVTFGAKTTFVTPAPTEDFETILAGIQDTKIDESGVENVFTAVKAVVQKWSRFRTEQFRRIMVVTVTDEAGDDFGTNLEPAIAYCNRYGAKAYVIGPSAVFGRRKGYVPYVAPEDRKTYNLPVDLGPETVVIENVSLPFWYSGRDYTYMSSGFAPYALARLVHETGGVYFMSNMTTMSGLSPIGVFDHSTLKPFLPDYSFGTPQEYEADLMKHPLRMAVVKAAFLSRKYKANGTPQTNFRVNPQNFKQTASNAQNTAAVSEHNVNMILQAFPPGIDQQFEREGDVRWRLNFALTYGRLLTHKVRNMEYNSAFAWIKNELVANDVATKSNQWIVRPDKELQYSGNLKKTAKKAQEMLEYVVAEAPGTPWAVLAQRELKDGVGIRIEQRFIPPPPPPKPGAKKPAAPRKRVLFAAQQKKKKAALKPPPPPKPVLPKL